MIKYILKRCFQSLLTALLVLCIVFFLMRMMPTDYFFTEDELMKFTDQQKYAKLERQGVMSICPTCHGSGLLESGEACPDCMTHSTNPNRGTGYIDRSAVAQLGDLFRDLFEMRVYNAKGKEVKTTIKGGFFCEEVQKGTCSFHDTCYGSFHGSMWQR